MNKDNEAKTSLAMKMAETISKDAREELLKHYPVALYEGEKVTEKNKPAHPKKYQAAPNGRIIETTPRVL